MKMRPLKTAHPRFPVIRWEILSLKRFPSPVFFDRSRPHRIRVPQRSNQQAGDEDVAGVPGLKWLD